MQKIKSPQEADRIISETETLVKEGYKLTVQQECRYEFAKILLREIGKRRKNRVEKLLTAMLRSVINNPTSLFLMSQPIIVLIDT